MKVIVALAALLTAAPVSPTGAYEHDEAAIVLVHCKRALGGVVGSAFKVGPNSYITADHVVREGTCTTGGFPITITHRDPALDYATFVGPFSPAVLRTSCRGFRAGQTYVARGYPGGGPINIFTPWQATSVIRARFRVFFGGDSIPGMSGGPLLDETGAAVGVANMRFPARSMPLKNTGYCKR